MKKFICIVMALVLVITIVPTEVQASTKYGFTYDTSVCNVKWSTMYTFNVYSEES